MANVENFAERFTLARENSIHAQPESGFCGLEIEWNLLDSQFHPLLTIGSGPEQISFVDYLRTFHIPESLRDYSQLEVFHWMIEWATRPFFNPRAAVYESRLMEATLLNSLYKAGREFDERFYVWHGNLPFLTKVNPDSIPGSWHLAKRRYLERCVNLYGDSLATTGTHSNLSLPDALFKWDFMQLPAEERTGGVSPPVHLDKFKSQFYITASGLMRAFASLFIAISASTPFKAGMKNGSPVVYLTTYDSIRNLTFPNPTDLDLPYLYRSLEEYLDISYDLVRRGIRFGNNNWTPVRARSFAEPVERVIDLTSDQLQELYSHGLYVLGVEQSLDELVNEIEVQNLLARIDIPMARVEIRSDDGGNPLNQEIANLTFKYLLLLKMYADPEFARSFEYDPVALERVRKNEVLAAKHGLAAEIEDPFTSKMVGMREFLNWGLGEVQSLADLLNLSEDLTPLKEMAAGAPNESERIRARICAEMGGQVNQDCHQMAVPREILRSLAEEREQLVFKDVRYIVESYPDLAGDEDKLGDFVQFWQAGLFFNPYLPQEIREESQSMIELIPAGKVGEILELASQLINIPSITAGSAERLDEVHRASNYILDYLRDQKLAVRHFNQGTYPAILAGFPGQLGSPVMLSGHFDVVAPEPDDSQFMPRIEGDYLWGRGAADMKTVLATYLVWLKDELKKGAPYPPISLMLIGNEEIGEMDPVGTPHVLESLGDEGYLPELLIAGERTGEKGDEKWGEICVENRGIMRFEITARGVKGHTGTASQVKGVSLRLLAALTGVRQYLENTLTLEAANGWRSQYNIPFIQLGEENVFNIQPDAGKIGIEIRPIPQDDLHEVSKDLQSICDHHGCELDITVMQNGIVCNPANPYLLKLIAAVNTSSGGVPKLGKKLPGTSARFAPQGQGIVWGQSGLNPHAKDEKHFIPSIEPYYNALSEFGRLLRAS